ncbi:MAG TPA: phage Gp37/Gp68 family protein, partial [Candidatus Polarisedimenticolia bacterium]|nr:phage Gp37/Gp68 family protein [Candidatus Polarisedimenticolia bacterium]
MGDKTKIQWSEASWNCLVGCSRVSEGCRHCYAERTAYRAGAMGTKQYEGITKKVGGEVRWTGEVRFVESALDLPLRWKKPRRIFVNSMSDLFHEKVEDEWINRIFGVMAKAHWHTFQVLTKRPDRMLRYLTTTAAGGRHIWEAAQAVAYPAWAITAHEPPSGWPLPNVWLGVSVEDQATADERIPLLLETPAAVRWVSYEPALGLASFFGPDSPTWNRDGGLDWIVVGGESGPDARPFDLAWARQTIAQCRAGGVPV